MRKQKGRLMCLNNFLSTSKNRNICRHNYARKAANNLSKPNHIGILFEMIIDPDICKHSNTPFVEVTDEEGYFKENEAEILFSTHTIFHID